MSAIARAGADLDARMLDELRGIGDPLVEGLIAGDDASVVRGVLKIVAGSGVASADADPELRELLDTKAAAGVNATLKGIASGDGLPAMVDVDSILRANAVFERYGREIGAVLLLSSLPQAYAASWGVRPLAATAQLSSHPRRRIRATMQFLVAMTTGATERSEAERRWRISKDAKDPLDPRHGEAIRTAVRLRLFHHAVRRTLQPDRARDAWGPADSVPLNQEDQLATLLTFTSTVFTGLERLGIVLTEEDQRAHLALWDAIGELLGILDHRVRTEAGVPELRPRTRADADELFEVLSRRQFTSPQRDVSDHHEPPPHPTQGASFLARRCLEPVPEKPEPDAAADAPAAAADVAAAVVADADVAAADVAAADVADADVADADVADADVADADVAAADVADAADAAAADVADADVADAADAADADADAAAAAEPADSATRPTGPWPHSRTSLSEGRILLNQLLEELDEAMPAHARSAPLILMRHFASPRVADRLLLGGGGIGQAALGCLPRRRIRTGRYTAVEATNRIEAAVMRRLARIVSEHAVTSFLSMEFDHLGRRVPPFRFPGIDQLRGDARPRRRRQ
jgi:hypothetical protein